MERVLAQAKEERPEEFMAANNELKKTATIANIDRLNEWKSNGSAHYDG